MIQHGIEQGQKFAVKFILTHPLLVVLDYISQKSGFQEDLQPLKKKYKKEEEKNLLNMGGYILVVVR